MGMAASQARYLALTARKSNCEYEGQQINQARLVLSNQSANLFNQMLGLKVPVPPSTSDYTKHIYTYSDGFGKETKLENWQQLGTSDEDYNYVVTRSYNINRYTGSVKKMNDPQVQFTGTKSATSDELQKAMEDIAAAQKEYSKALEAEAEARKIVEYQQKLIADINEKEANLSNYATSLEHVNTCTYDSAEDLYTINYKDSDGATQACTLKGFASFTPAEQDAIKNLDSIQELINNGALSEDNLKNLYFAYDAASGNYTFANGNELSLLAVSSTLAGAEGLDQSFNVYNSSNIVDLLGKFAAERAPIEATLEGAEAAYERAQTLSVEKKDAFEAAKAVYDDYIHPTYVGNLDLTPIFELDKDQKAELNQVLADMREQGIDSELFNCFEYDEVGNITGYNGGVYSFKMNGVTYYTTYADLDKSYNSGTGPNHIDGQIKLPYYNATYVDTRLEETKKALVETDGNGRFTSIRFEDDSIVYTLNMGTETDDVAYQDAMNQYYYDNAVYDKMIRDINAKTSIIQQEDQQLELRLKQLDTEQNALSTEMEAVSKVVKDNVEKTFNTFGG